MDSAHTQPLLPRRTFVKGVGLVTVLGIAACSPVRTGADPTGSEDGTDGATSTMAPRSGGQLSVAKTVDIQGLDPHRDLVTYPGQWIMPLLYMPLFDIGADLKPRPGVAESFDVEDEGTTYVFHIRQGIKTHSGKTLDAEDVKFSLDRFLDPEAGSFAAGWLSDIDEVEVLDAQRLAIHLKQPNWALPESLYWMYVVPRSVGDEASDWTRNNEDGSGPFKLKQWNPGSLVELERYDEYHEADLPYLDTISLPVVPDESTAIGSLRSGELDLLSLSDPNNFRIIEDLDVEFLRQTIAGPFMINFNAKQDVVTSDVEFRRALALATDREEILEKVNAGLGNVTGIFSSAFDYAHIPPDELSYSTLDIDRAKTHLDASSYPKDRPVQLLTVASDPVMKATGELVKTQWQKLGLTIDLQVLEPNSWVDLVVNPGNESKWDITINSFAAFPNAHLQAQNIARGLAKFYGPTPDEFVNKVDEAASESDPARRSELYKEIARLVDDQVLQIFTYEAIQVDAHQPHVHQLIPYPDRTYRELEKAWVE